MPRMFLKLEELAKVIRILIFKDIQTILEKARSKSFKAVNTARLFLKGFPKNSAESTGKASI
ncbi:MAG: hypothetical protein DPW20_00625 [Candidatus Brocadia sp.]|uniref:Uncharacterized protein n=1 Tax=Candidatus Brocadia sinica JPN1 TaxID=1197129 RepID=A0ABQ0JVU1_9BACT|nr:MAG: hypothetical protein EDM70_01610 [Candidatus Brocadia sp. AMX2]MBL1167719.1 hypothetical protein [Candidatus Brocadia sp. AMX1]MCQ3915889.1 hypothetical protein [Candidatus Brocadia sp.]GAN32820.1 hypothetical protein BROSI_A1335 [Candidatus Brocadia sinica JPN1]GIK13656.1 MAG: hypothetical protein BroJett002_23630 [Candidatus Brocadia sinica]